MIEKVAENWNEEPVRDVVRLIAASGTGGASLVDRRLRLLREIGNWLGVDAWEFDDGRGWRVREAREAALTEEKPGFSCSMGWTDGTARWNASRRGGCAFPPERERAVRMIFDLSPWLADGGDWVAPGRPDLSPRARQVLDLLLTGASRKEIADSLGISINTVAGYARDLYRRFGVNSQAMLQRICHTETNRH